MKDGEILKVQEYHIVVKSVWSDEYDRPMDQMHRECKGFSARELLGLLEYVQLDILKQMAGEVRPDIVKRVVVENDSAAEEC